MDRKIGIIGLGYVGLPLARIFAKKYTTKGYDINSERIQQLNKFEDSTKELTREQLKEVLHQKTGGLILSDRMEDLKDCDFYIITVPTPVDDNHKPDLKHLVDASRAIGGILKDGDVVVYESTVFPGATEEVCVPILEESSGKKLNNEFFVGYSPERINPADKLHTVDKILKVTSGSTASASQLIDSIYSSVISAGTYLAPSIKVAEAAKVIENSQRDINIAFVNELAKIFNLLEIDTQEVLKAAATKWNFLPFKPGLVGGHCIGVDPYYLAQKALEVGYHPEIILAGRRMNDSMGAYVSSEVVKLMLKKEIAVKGSKALVMGLTFKENCPDVRNSKVIDIINDLEEYGIEVDIFDPVADPVHAKHQLGMSIRTEVPTTRYEAIIVAVAHDEFFKIDLSKLKTESSVIYDVKGIKGTIADKRL